MVECPIDEVDRPRGAKEAALRIPPTEAAAEYLPSWADKLTPHVLRHFCASDLSALAA